MLLSTTTLPELQKTSFPDSKIATSRSCSRTKTTALVKNVIGLQQYENVADLMRKNKFGICIDESTDISTTKNLSIVVRIAIDGKIRDLFFDLLKVELADAVTIYNRLVEMFEKSNINYKSNLIGFAADRAAVMTGKNHSVAKVLRNDCPNLVIIKCVCHSMALCASYACKKLPSVVEKMAKNIYNYIQNSPKRVSNFEKICTILESGKPKKILHPSQTRWLSLESVVNRLLEMYNELLAYFTVTAKLDDADNGEIILEQLNDPVNNLYLKFLQFILPQINKINRLFQSESAQIHKLNSNVKTLLFSILDCFMKPEYLKNCDLNNVNFENVQNLLDYEDFYFGTEVNLQLNDLILNKRIKNSEVINFKNNCISFYIELAQQILKRFNFNNKILTQISIIDPQNVINKSSKSIIPLCSLFPNLIDRKNYQAIDLEYREVRNLELKNMFANTTDINIEDFWETICTLKCGDNSFRFPLLAKFIFEVLCIPISSANVERTFSQINLNITKTRNRLKTDTLKGILLTKDYLKVNNTACYNLKESKALFDKFNKCMYNKSQ